MYRRSPLLAVSLISLLSFVSTASQCPKSRPTEIEEEDSAPLSGVWDYQRNVNGGYWYPDGYTVWWLLTFENESGKAHFSSGYIDGYDAEFGSKRVWQHTGSNIAARYERQGTSVTFFFDDRLNPRRASFTGQLVSSNRIQGDWEAGDKWFAERCDLSIGNCGG